MNARRLIISSIALGVMLFAAAAFAQDTPVSGNEVDAPVFAGSLPSDITTPDEVFNARKIRVSVTSPEGLGLYGALGTAKANARNRIVESILQLPMIAGTRGFDLFNTDALVESLGGLVFDYAEECGDTPEQARRYDAGRRFGSICMELEIDVLFRQLVYNKKLRVPLYKNRGAHGFFIPNTTDAPAAAYDSIIVDARQTDLVPAVVNRVMTDNQTLVYDPLMVNGEEPKFPRSPATASSIEAARTILLERGATMPLIVNGAEAVNETEVRVSPSDASLLRRAANVYPIFNYGYIVYLVASNE